MYIEIINSENHKTIILSADDYIWDGDFFLVYAYAAMDFFHIDNIISITVDGVSIPLPVSSGSE